MKNHSTYYATRNDCMPVLQFDDLQIQIVDSDLAEIHFDDNTQLHVQIDRENIKRILAFMDSIKTTAQ
jgi:hypothetical protein